MSVEAVLLHHADWKDFKAVILTPPSALDMMQYYRKGGK